MPTTNDPTDLSYLSAPGPITTANAPLPGVGGVGSTPDTDAQNLSVASAMSRADQSNAAPVAPIGADPKLYGAYTTNSDTTTGTPIDPMAAINGRLQAITTSLASNKDPDRPAIYVTPTRRQQILQEYYGLTNAAHENALTSAHAAAQAFQQNKDIQSAGQFVNLATGLQNLKSKPGDPTYANDIYGLVAANPLGAQSKAAGEIITKSLQHHSEVSKLYAGEQGAQFFATPEDAWKQYPGAELTQTRAGYSIHLLKPGANAASTSSSPNPVAKELLQAHKITPNELLNPASVKYGTMDDKGNFMADADGRTGGTVAQIEVGRDRPVQMSASEYARYKTALAPSSAPTITVDPRIALAQKALSDPNASDAHKAAAKRILGK